MEDASDNYYIRHPDGTVTVNLAMGREGRLNAKLTPSESTINLEQIQSVGVENLMHVESHTINSLFGSTSHYIRFCNGGEVTYAHNSEGKLLELIGKNVSILISKDNRVTFTTRWPAGPDASGENAESNHPQS